MKKILTFSAIALFGIAVISGCIKSSSSPHYTMTATIGVTPYILTNCEAYYYASLRGRDVVISANQNTIIGHNYIPSITLQWVDSSISTGTFSLADSTIYNSTECAVSPAPGYTLFAVNGSVTITSVSPTVVGTFSFTCTDSTVVSNEKFTSEIYGFIYLLLPDPKI